MPCPMHANLPCGGNGVCYDPRDTGSNTTAPPPPPPLPFRPAPPPPALLCACNPLYSGEACESQLCPGSPHECSGESRGACVSNTAGARVCECLEGFSGPSCATMSCDGGCSGRGSCVVGVGSTKPSCVCDDVRPPRAATRRATPRRRGTPPCRR
eukprot:195081-Prymnesium_polylepis.1